MASPKGLAKSLNAFVEDAKTVVTGSQAPSSGADQAVASSSTDYTPSPRSPEPVEESEENKAYVRGYNDALKDIPSEHADSASTVIESEAATENDASQRTELGDSPSEDGNHECPCGHGAEQGEDDLDSHPVSPEEFERLIPVVTKSIVEAISLPIVSDDIPARGGPGGPNFADVRCAIMTVYIQRALRALGEDVVCTPAGHDKMGIVKGELPWYFQGMVDDELAEMIRVLKRPIPNPGISLPADEIRARLLLVFRRRCWSQAPYRMRAWWVNDSPHTRESGTYEIVRESLGGSVVRDSSRMVSEREGRAERGILGRQGFSKFRDVVSKARSMVLLSLDEEDEERAELDELYLGGRPYRGSSRASDDLHGRTYEHMKPRSGERRDSRDASRDVSRDRGSGGQRSGGGSTSGSRPIRKKYDDISYVLEARGSRIGGQRFGGGLGSRLRSRSRDNDFSDAEEPRGRPLGGSFGDDSDAQAIRGRPLGGSFLDDSDAQAIRGRPLGGSFLDDSDAQAIRGRPLGGSFLDDYPITQAIRGWGPGGRLEWRQRSFGNDCPDAHQGPPAAARFWPGIRRTFWDDVADSWGLLETFSPRDRAEYNDSMDRSFGCGCEICREARQARHLDFQRVRW